MERTNKTYGFEVFRRIANLQYFFRSVLRIRILGCLYFLGLPDPLVRVIDPVLALDPDPPIINQYLKNLESYCFVTFYDNDVNVDS